MDRISREFLKAADCIWSLPWDAFLYSNVSPVIYLFSAIICNNQNFSSSNWVIISRVLLCFEMLKWDYLDIL